METSPNELDAKGSPLSWLGKALRPRLIGPDQCVGEAEPEGFELGGVEAVELGGLEAEVVGAAWLEQAWAN